MTLELLKLEQKAHSSEKEGLACLRNNLSRDVMLPGIIESYRKFYQETAYKRWCRVFFTVVIELLLLSYVPFMYDIYSDIVLAVSYHRIAYSNKTFDESELSNCSGNQLNFSCYERTRMSIREPFPNSSFDTLIQSDGFQSYENSLNLHQMFEAAFIATCFSIIISLSFYIYSIPIDLQGLFSLPYNIRKIMPDKFNQGVTRMQWFMNDKSRRKNRVVLFLSKIFLMGLGKVLWPFIHILRRMQYLASLKSSEHSDLHLLSDQTWANIKAVEYGVESSLQMLLQLWLLKPFLSEISLWSTTDVVVRCATGLANFVTFDKYPACYIEKALGKILLTIISLTLGVANMKCYKHGQGFTDKPLKTIPIFLSILAQTIARIFAFKSLILMKTSLGFFKYAVFFLSHFMAVFTIKVLFENPSLQETSTALSEACQSKRLTSVKTLSWNLFRFIFSGLSSTIILIHLRQNQPASPTSHFTFLPHTLFFVLSLIQNFVLVTLPYLAPDLYPEVDCFTTDSRSKAVWIVVVLWFVGVITQVIHYKMAHDWSPLNGPQVSKSELEFDFTVPWSRRNRRLKASNQGFKCKKIYRNSENTR